MLTKNEIKLHDISDYDIAIIGMSVILPSGITTLADFWQAKINATPLIKNYQDFVPNVPENKKLLTKCGYIDELFVFPVNRYNISSNDASLMDPQLRLLIKNIDQALYDSHQSTNIHPRIGIFATTGINYYVQRIIKDNPDFDFTNIIRLNDSSFIATRIAHNFNFKGPAITIQSACSSSLVAVHMATQSILSGDSDIAVVGACSLLLPEHRYLPYKEGGILSPSGECKPFDIDADGTVQSSGSGVVILKSAKKAFIDGDKVYACIKGSSVNNDGAGKTGFGAPSVEGQSTVLAEGLQISGFNPDDINFIETHGTGTYIGDVTEMHSIAKVYGQPQNTPPYLGAIKSIVGHTDTASGIIGLISTVLNLQHKTIPKLANFSKINPDISHYAENFLIPESKIKMPPTAQPIRAAINSFGVGGTNCHLILEEARFNARDPLYESVVDYGAQTVYEIKAKHDLAVIHSTTINTEKSVNELSVKQFSLEKIKSILGYEAIDLSNRFYDYGGDSISLIELTEAIEKNLV